MIIKYKDYRLVPDDDRFNLIEKGIGTKKDSEETFEKEDNLGYGFTLLGAISKIVSLELVKNNKEVSLSEYLKEYNAMYNTIKTELSSY